MTEFSLDKSREFQARASQSLGGGVGHDLRYAEPVPIYITHGRGSRKWDVDGNEYVDFLMGNAALLLGHADPAVVTAIEQAVGDGTHFGNDHPRHIAWAELVCQLLPSAERVRFVNSGTEATLLAFRLARAFTSRQKVMRFAGHFHGWHDDVVHGFEMPFDRPVTLGVSGNEKRDMVTLSDSDSQKIQTELAGGDYAAVIVEVTGASWGRAPLPAGLLEMLREETRSQGTVLIFDEVISGFRFSPGGIQQLAGITPDLTCLAKILAGGMPGGAVAGSSEVMRLFDKSGDAEQDRYGRVVHFGTFNASPLSAAAGIATLEKLADGTPIEQANTRAVEMRGEIAALLQKHDVAGFVYGEASLFHVYFETDPDRLGEIGSAADVPTADPRRLKGMPASLVSRYQALLRHAGVDLMSGTGGALASCHTSEDIQLATSSFDSTILALLDEGHIQQIG
jgi:glutamate-1-semialdehyde 2,1-aminomutase